MKNLIIGLLTVVSFSAIAAETSDFLNDVSQRLSGVCHKSTIHREFSTTHQTFIDGKLTYLTAYEDVSRLGIITLTNRITRICHLSTMQSKVFRNKSLVELAQENFPEENWTTEKLLQGWSGFSWDDTNARVSDIYDFSK